MREPDNEIIKEEFIKCDCGTHLLQVQSYVHLYPDGAKTRFSQDINLAMFTYGSSPALEKWWRRVWIGLKYMWTGKMFADQVVLCPEEASKLMNFLSMNLIVPEPEA